MNSLERTLARIAGEPVDRPPNFDILMQYAAHLIGAPLSRYYQDYRVLCEANMAALEAFDLDIVQTISDPYREAADLGMKIEFPEDNLPLGIDLLLADPARIASRPLRRPHRGARAPPAAAGHARYPSGRPPSSGQCRTGARTRAFAYTAPLT